MRKFCSTLSALFLVLLLAAPSASLAQQTLGGITGTVTDPSGSAIPDVDVVAVEQDTKLTRTARSNSQGSYTLNDLPIGQYTLSFKHEGFTAQKFPGILVQADR
ncbi:MAG TPA: carboxypeptidase-like regulatory domain-containing protein, partial [Acidobacteriaceae bacterium]